VQDILAEAGAERARKDVTASEDDASDATHPEPVSIDYNLLFFSTEELKKPIRRRQPKAGYAVLKDNLSWDDFYEQIKVKACDALFSMQAVVDAAAFDVFFQIS